MSTFTPDVCLIDVVSFPLPVSQHESDWQTKDTKLRESRKEGIHQHAQTHRDTYFACHFIPPDHLCGLVVRIPTYIQIQRSGFDSRRYQIF
jgi:hypothetical protein